MKTRGAGAFSVTMLLTAAAGVLVVAALDVDSSLVNIFNGVAQSFRESTGLNPGRVFRRVSLLGEARTQAEMLVANYYLQLYFTGAALTAILSVVFIMGEKVLPTSRHQALFVSFLITLLAPLALATVTYTAVFVYPWSQTVCILILVSLGIFATFELLRVKPKTIYGKLLHPIVLLLIMIEGIILPAFYGWHVFWQG
jgi:hypothetical protein